MNVLFATVPADGHVNPLTGIAMHLKATGHEVRWYTGPSYAAKLERWASSITRFRGPAKSMATTSAHCSPNARNCMALHSFALMAST